MKLKKIISLCITLCISVSFSTSVLAAVTGDLNGDNIINSSDLDELVKNFNSKEIKYDLNKDGTVDVYDMTYIERNMVKETTTTEHKGALGVTRTYILYLRPQPTANSKSDILIPIGTQLNIHSRIGNYYKVTYINEGGKKLDGYITRYVDIIKDDDNYSFLGTLSEKYESNGDPGCISTGNGDYGGKSYGAWQLSSKMGAVDAFLIWLKDVNKSFYETLDSARKADNLGASNFGESFDSAWVNISTSHYDEFLKIQQAYVKEKYYDEIVKRIKKLEIYPKVEDKFSTRNVLWSLSVQHGALGAQKLIQNSAAREDYLGFIEDVYAERSKVDVYFYNSPTLHKSLVNRFNNEKLDALRILEYENSLK